VQFAESQLMFQRTMSLSSGSKNKQRKQSASKVLLRFMLVSYLVRSLTIKTNAIYSSEMFVDFQWTA
jgi:hypothetical protein